MELETFNKVAQRVEINTNNGWGFGGIMGHALKHKGFEISKVKRCFRHTGQSKVITHYRTPQNKMDVVSKETFEAELSKLI